jgi:eukaryotic-like serine/threonine-protein kinase
MAKPSWARVKEVIETALDRAPSERADCVLQMCGGDDALRAEVQSLLAAIDRAGTFIERPALQSLSESAGLSANPIHDTAPHALDPGDSVGPYEVLEFLGAGGMGEVYRAGDTHLNRDVALKVLPQTFASDSDRLARFTREAHVLASLNHPNIAAIYGFEEADGVQALVLELVEGPTLAGRIAQGAIPLPEALSIARQIAEGLKAAHERGIIHRDLKPSNVKVRSDGAVKILDFGLAKALNPSESGSAVPALATITSPAMIHAGVIFGTAAYMSPEHARGQTVDKRSDIWAFGCVLYETLSGRQAFRGETIQDTLAHVLAHDPDWSVLPAGTPAGIVRLLRRCLDKDPDRRLHDIADARLEIEDAAGAPPIAVATARHRLAYWGLAAAVAVAAVALIVWGRLPPDAAPAAQTAVRRLLIGLPGTQPLARAASMPLGDGQASLAISPDGTRIAYVMEGGDVRQLYLHALDQLEGAPIPLTEGAFGPFFSPDGGWVGFFAGNKLKKAAVSGGDPIDLSAAPIRTGEAGERTERSCLPPTKGVVRQRFTRPAAYPGWSRSKMIAGRGRGRTCCPAERRPSFRMWRTWGCWRWTPASTAR